MRNLNELFKGLKDEIDFASKENKITQCQMLHEARANLIRANEGYTNESEEEAIYFTGVASGIILTLRKYFNYEFERLMVANFDKMFPTDFRVDKDKVEEAITKLSEGKISFVK